MSARAALLQQPQECCPRLTRFAVISWIPPTTPRRCGGRGVLVFNTAGPAWFSPARWLTVSAHRDARAATGAVAMTMPAVAMAVAVHVLGQVVPVQGMDGHAPLPPTRISVISMRPFPVARDDTRACLRPGAQSTRSRPGWAPRPCPRLASTPSLCFILLPPGCTLSRGCLHRCSGWHLAPTGARACDTGVAASQAQCVDAVKQVAASAGRVPGRGLQIGSWSWVPPGCSAQSGGDWTPHFKTSGDTSWGTPAYVEARQWKVVRNGHWSCFRSLHHT